MPVPLAHPDNFHSGEEDLGATPRAEDDVDMDSAFRKRWADELESSEFDFELDESAKKLLAAIKDKASAPLKKHCK